MIIVIKVNNNNDNNYYYYYYYYYDTELHVVIALSVLSLVLQCLQMEEQQFIGLWELLGIGIANYHSITHTLGKKIP